MSKLPALLLLTLTAFADTRLGKPLTLPTPAPVGEILRNSESHLGKTVQVKGKITEVCQMMGCWMALVDPADSSQIIRIKVADGDIVFPKDAAGKTAIAEGMLSKKVLTKDQVVAAAKHEASEQGRKFNPKSVKNGSTTFEIQGSGAVLID